LIGRLTTSTFALEDLMDNVIPNRSGLGDLCALVVRVLQRSAAWSN
jgi:hypothetical protein